MSNLQLQAWAEEFYSLLTCFTATLTRLASQQQQPQWDTCSGLKAIMETMSVLVWDASQWTTCSGLENDFLRFMLVSCSVVRIVSLDSSCSGSTWCWSASGWDEPSPSSSIGSSDWGTLRSRSEIIHRLKPCQEQITSVKSRNKVLSADMAQKWRW